MIRARTRPGGRIVRCPPLLVSVPALVAVLLFSILPAAAVRAAGPLSGVPPLARWIERARSTGDGLEFEDAGGTWERVSVEALEPVSERHGPFEQWSWWVSDEGFRGQAEDRAGEWLRLGELDLGDRRIRASKEMGERVRITSFTGYQASSQRMLRVDYLLRHGLVLRSEARERGESHIVLEWEQTFR